MPKKDLRRRPKTPGPGITETAFPTDHVPVTPDNSLVYHPAITIYVGTSGDVVCEDTAGVEATYRAVPAGNVVPVRASKVKETTTAEDLVGVY